MLPLWGRYTTLRLLDIVDATSLAASMRRSSMSPLPAALVASEMSLAASLSPSALMTEAWEREEPVASVRLARRVMW